MEAGNHQARRASNAAVPTMRCATEVSAEASLLFLRAAEQILACHFDADLSSALTT